MLSAIQDTCTRCGVRSPLGRQQCPPCVQVVETGRIRWAKTGREIRKSWAGRPCAMCGGPADTIDHIVPLSFGGSNVPDNLQPACRSCNNKRQSKAVIRAMFNTQLPMLAMQAAAQSVEA